MVAPGAHVALFAALAMGCGHADDVKPPPTAEPPDPGAANMLAAPAGPACLTRLPPSFGTYVTTTGTASGDGSAASPWDLATALKSPSVKPGDTIWVRAGTYRGAFVSKLVGASGAPVTVRSYPGEWAVLDGAGQTDPALQVYKSWTVIRDLEITNSDPNRGVDRPSGIYVEGSNLAFVDLVVHDVGTGIIGNSATADAPEPSPGLLLYGSIFYDNGWNAADRAHGHHVYLQNRDGKKTIADNAFFHSYGFGIHAYSDDDTHWVQGYDIVGNVWFSAGAASTGESKLYDDCLIGQNGTHPVGRIRLEANMGWASGPGERNVRLGYSAPANQDVTLENNYLVGGVAFVGTWQSVAMRGNTVYGDVSGVETAAYPDNHFLTSPPASAEVFVRPNVLEPGRALVVVYNWAAQTEVPVDLSSVVAVGATYDVKNVQDPLGSSVASGVYTGGSVALPMTGLSRAQPTGDPGAITPAEQTGAAFNAFLITSRCP
jgi:hypothetical protein